jgi:hypothetical protein
MKPGFVGVVSASVLIGVLAEPTKGSPHDSTHEPAEAAGLSQISGGPQCGD